MKTNICRTIILLVVVFGCETWSVTPREERRLSVFRNMVLREVFESKKKEETVGLRKLHSEQLHNEHRAPNRIMVIQSRTMAWVVHVTHMLEMRHVYRVFSRAS